MHLLQIKCLNAFLLNVTTFIEALASYITNDRKIKVHLRIKIIWMHTWNISRELTVAIATKSANN